VQWICYVDVQISDIEAQIRDLQSRKKDLIEEIKEKERVGLGESGFYDRDIYDGGGSKYDGYVTSIAANDEVDVSNDILLLEFITILDVLRL
jgi:splicing factor 3B subunit 1